jgi:hypothetical protein
MKPVSEFIGSVPSGASVSSSGFIHFLAKIKAGGTNMPVGRMQHTTVTVCTLSPAVTLQTIFFPIFNGVVHVFLFSGVWLSSRIPFIMFFYSSYLYINALVFDIERTEFCIFVCIHVFEFVNKGNKVLDVVMYRKFF